jgi:N-methylhydantoinase B
VVHDIIRKNVRTSDIVIGDIRAQVSAGNVGKLRLLELFEAHGKDMILAAMTELLDHAEVLTRQELQKIPDGSYSFVDYLDNDGVDLDKLIKIQATVTVQGSDFIVDFSGSSPQVKGPFNVPPSGALAATTYVLRAFTDFNIPSNDGCFRPITLKLPEGSIFNPRPPAATGARAATICRAASVLMGALVKAAPERLPAGSADIILAVIFGGIDPHTGKEFVLSESGVGGMGARPNKDGIDVISVDVNDLMNVPTEALEIESPLRVLETGLLTDSGGAGKYRGGLGFEKVWEVLRGSFSTTFRGERHYTRPWGLFGGLPGSSCRGLVVRKTGEVEEIPSKGDLILTEGDKIFEFTPGGGGYGDPLERKPELVLRDVLDKKVSLEAAAEDYSVVIEKGSMKVDLEKTSELREEKARLRGPITWTYDRGPELGKE